MPVADSAMLEPRDMFARLLSAQGLAVTSAQTSYVERLRADWRCVLPAPVALHTRTCRLEKHNENQAGHIL